MGYCDVCCDRTARFGVCEECLNTCREEKVGQSVKRIEKPVFEFESKIQRIAVYILCDDYCSRRRMGTTKEQYLYGPSIIIETESKVSGTYHQEEYCPDDERPWKWIGALARIGLWALEKEVDIPEELMEYWAPPK